MLLCPKDASTQYRRRHPDAVNLSSPALIALSPATAATARKAQVNLAHHHDHQHKPSHCNGNHSEPMIIAGSTLNTANTATSIKTAPRPTSTPGSCSSSSNRSSRGHVMQWRWRQQQQHSGSGSGTGSSKHQQRKATPATAETARKI